MAYKVFSSCVENGKVVQKAPSSTLTAVGTAVRPKWFTMVIKAKWKFPTFEEKVLIFSGSKSKYFTPLRSNFPICLVYH